MDHSFPPSVLLATPVGPRARSLISVRLVLVCVCTFSSMFSAVPHVYSIRFTGCAGFLYARPPDVALDSSLVFVLVAVAFSFLFPSPVAFCIFSLPQHHAQVANGTWLSYSLLCFAVPRFAFLLPTSFSPFSIFGIPKHPTIIELFCPPLYLF